MSSDGTPKEFIAGKGTVSVFGLFKPNTGVLTHF